MSVHTSAVDAKLARQSHQQLRRIKRIRRARLSYPAALVELALVLSATVGKRQAASVIGVGVSTVYRWVDSHRTAWMPREALRTDGSGTFTADVITALSTRCQRAGFRVNSPSMICEGTESGDVLSGHPYEQENSSQSVALSVEASDVVTANELAAMDSMSLAKHEIDTKYAMPLSCRQLAAVAKMPRIQFIRKFSSTFGVPPYHYLLGVRVERAIELLQYSSEPLAVVATTTGFGSSSSMQRAFKQFAGGSPGMVVKAIAPKRNLASSNSGNAPRAS